MESRGSVEARINRGDPGSVKLKGGGVRKDQALHACSSNLTGPLASTERGTQERSAPMQQEQERSDDKL